MSKSPQIPRRTFLKTAAASVAVAAPMIVPSRVVGANPPSERITVGMIGYGRQAHHVNTRQLLASPNAQIVAVCDVDSWRREQGQKRINKEYAKQTAKKSYNGCKAYEDFREILARDDVDAVMVSTPDHWHVPMAIAAARAGKHVSLEKPVSTALRHGRLMCDAIKKAGVVGRTDSEFRPQPSFRMAAEMVRNGAIGKLTHIEVVVPGDSKPIGTPKPMDVPKELNYDLWQGPALEKPYTLQRVHARRTLSERPGWLRISDYTNGMLANWGAHMLDQAQWGNDTEHTSPVKIAGTGKFSVGMWDTIVSFDMEYEYANGVTLKYTMGPNISVKFVGEKGWIKAPYAPGKMALTASDPKLIKDYSRKEGDVDFSGILSDKEDWLNAIKTGGETMYTVEEGHRVNSIAQTGLIAVTLGRALEWNPETEQFVNDKEADKLLDRPVRGDWLKV